MAKLRENNKDVIGVGVKNSTSDLLIASCDEFIYYDDLVREQKPRARTPRRAQEAAKRAEKLPRHRRVAAACRRAEADGNGNGKESRDEDKQQEAFDLVLATIEELIAERGGDEKIWGSMVKQALKRRRPGFNERYYGFKSFNDLLEEAADRAPARASSATRSPAAYVILSAPETP